MLAEGGYKKGCVLCDDAPVHRSVEELLELSWEVRNESINKLDTRTTKTAAGKRGKDVDRYSKTGAEYIQQMKTNLEFAG